MHAVARRLPRGGVALLTSLLPLAPTAACAQGLSESVSVGAFVDAYFAWGFSRPPTLDRAYTTQPARHCEFNVNLAFVEARLNRDNLRGRLALQAGSAALGRRHGVGSGPYGAFTAAGWSNWRKLRETQ